MPIETPAWVRDAIFYQIFPDRFAMSDRVVKPGPLEPWDGPPTVYGFKGGDLYGVLERLDHIQALGVNALYFNPVFQSASNHRYHTYDYLAVDPLLGGTAALRALIDACHDRGMRVVLDGVFNHASRGFWPFHHVLEAGRASPYRDWFFFNNEDLDAGRPIRAYPLEPTPPGDAQIPGRRSREQLGYEAWWDLPALPKLNTWNAHMREYLFSVAEHWIRFGADGWRLDVAEEVPDEFWRVFRDRVKTVNPDAYLVAEIWHEAPDGLQGDMYDAVMNYPLAAAILSFTAAGRLDRRVIAQQFTLNALVADDDAPSFASRLARAMSVYDPVVTAAQLNLLDSHDTPRFLSMVGGDVQSLRLATLIQMTLPGAPSIYYGDEIGLTGEGDPLNRGTFPWHDLGRWDRELMAYMAGVATLRNGQAVLRRGGIRIAAAEGRTIAYVREDGSAAALVVVNAGNEPVTLDVHVGELDGRTLIAQHWPGSMAIPAEDPVSVHEGRVRIELPARDGAVFLAE
jgi:cyclomaltodextrinase